MSPITMATLLPALFCFLLGTPLAEAVDRVVSVVGERLVTQSDLDLEAALVGLDESIIPPLAQESDLLRRLEDYRLIRSLAGELPIYVPPHRDLDARLVAIQSRFDSGNAYLAFLARWGMAESDLRNFLRSRMVVENFVHRAVGLTVQADFEPQDPEYNQRYREAYEIWIEPLRTDRGIRRIPVASP